MFGLIRSMFLTWKQREETEMLGCLFDWNKAHVQFSLLCRPWPTSGAVALHCAPVSSTIYHGHLSLSDSCWKSSFPIGCDSTVTSECSYVRIWSDFGIKDWKIIHTVCQTDTQSCCLRFGSVCDATSGIKKKSHNTNSAVTLVVVFAASQNRNEATVCV